MQRRGPRRKELLEGKEPARGAEMERAEETTGLSAKESDLAIKVTAASCSVSSRTGSSAGEATYVVVGEFGGLSVGFKSEGPRIAFFLL
jgi:hypothetical protein